MIVKTNKKDTLGEQILKTVSNKASLYIEFKISCQIIPKKAWFFKIARSRKLFTPTCKYFYMDISVISVTFCNSVFGPNNLERCILYFFFQISLSLQLWRRNNDYFGLFLLLALVAATMMAIFAFLQELSENCNWQFLGYFYKSFVLCGSETLVIILSLKNILVILYHILSHTNSISFLRWWWMPVLFSIFKSVLISYHW